MLQTFKRNIPNFITLCNLLCGAVAAWQAVLGNLQYAAIFILLGIFFDFIDGKRLLRLLRRVGGTATKSGLSAGKRA